DLIKELGGASESFYTEIAFPPCTLKLSRTDWRIMAALRPDATKSYGTLANELGLSRKTVKRRLDRMVAGNAVFTMAAHEVRNAESPEANMAVFYEDSADRSKTDPEILRVLADHLLYAGIWPGYSVYAVAIPNVARGDELAARVRGVEGVRDARSSIIDERVELFESLDGMIAKNL
ncbi:MAG TPA: AsnC family protein, partial [Nitrososphaerales archaeon]|nr:AsnC family protein [Nitrososphaerales archaeon]